MAKILIVEDDANLRMLMTMRLKSKYEVAAAADGRAALEIFENGGIDLIVTDLMMPGLDGYALVESIRSMGCDTPVIMLTAKDGMNDKGRGFAAGTDDYMTKPVNFEELTWRIDALLRRSKIANEGKITIGDVVVDKQSRRVLGIQGACENGDSVKARTDMVAALLQHGKPTVADICTLEAAYAPPFAAAMDVINVVGNVAENVLEGRFTPVTAEEFMDLWRKRDDNHIFFIDARPAKAGQAVQAEHPEWHSIPLEDVEARIGDVPRDRKVAVICNTGLRAYDVVLTLARHGITDVVNSEGGMQAVLKMGMKP